MIAETQQKIRSNFGADFNNLTIGKKKGYLNREMVAVRLALPKIKTRAIAEHFGVKTHRLGTYVHKYKNDQFVNEILSWLK
jgi:hypothetical protein